MALPLSPRADEAQWAEQVMQDAAVERTPAGGDFIIGLNCGASVDEAIEAGVPVALDTLVSNSEQGEVVTTASCALAAAALAVLGREMLIGPTLQFVDGQYIEFDAALMGSDAVEAVMSGLTEQLGEPGIERYEAEVVEMKSWRVGEGMERATVCIITRIGEEKPTSAGFNVAFLDYSEQLRDQAVAEAEAAA